MGNLIRVLTRDLDSSGCNFFLDFEHAQPSEAERATFEKVKQVLEEGQEILEELQMYKGAGEEIRQAIQRPTVERLQQRAWAAVLPLVTKLHTFYDFSQKLESALCLLLDVFACAEAPPTQQLEQKQALAQQFAHILHFTLRFDELKMTTPAIQNDFSYYRRTISRMKINKLTGESQNEVDNELANRMSLFYACSTPMLKTLSDATDRFVSEIKGCIRLLKEQSPNSVEGLLNALRYTTKHLNDETTPKQIKNMLQPN
uniref:CYRIA/CYRIB Rac1 binding domain-containing protein n=1 Tax=Periophthalmus magnuspinnatus TaxID=409849 RepID=A0A3B4BBR1_9GOBI